MGVASRDLERETCALVSESALSSTLVAKKGGP